MGNKEQKSQIDWCKHFDQIYCVQYLPQTDRLPRLNAELSRVGILDSGIFQFRYTTPSRYDKIIWEAEQSEYRSRLAPKPSFVNICLEIRKILAESLAFGYKRILLLENDVAFLKDISLLSKYLDETPGGFGVVQYDKFVNPEWKAVYDSDVRNYRITPTSNYFESAHDHFYSSAACLGLFNEGIQEFLDVMDWHICATDVAYQFVKCRYAVAVNNLCVQIRFADSNNEASRDAARRMDWVYKTQGIDYNDYAVPEGYNYGMAWDLSKGNNK